MRAHLCFVLFLFLQSASSRPVFQREVHAIADEDGFFRHSSVKRSQQTYSLEYTAKLAPGVVSLDKDDAVEEVICADALYIRTTEIRNWNIGDILVGGPEWGCLGENGEPMLVAVKADKIERNSEGIYRISGEVVGEKDIFEHLSLSLETVEGLPNMERGNALRQKPAISFPNFPEMIYPGVSTRIFIDIDATQFDANEKIKVEWDYNDLSSSILPEPNIVTLDVTAKYFDWTAPSVSNPVWSSEFEFSWKCTLGVCRGEAKSPKFWIHKAAPVFLWNQASTGAVIDPSIVYVNLTCGTAAFCRTAGACPACEIPKARGNFAVSCKNCKAAVGAGINRFTIDIGVTSVTNFTFNSTVSFKSNLEFQVENSFEYSGDFKTFLFGTVLYGIPNFSVAGLGINLGLYLDLEFHTKFQSAGQSFGSVILSPDVRYDVIYNEVTPLTVNAVGGWGTPVVSALGNAGIIAKYGIVPTLRLGIMTNLRALFASVEPYALWKLKASYPLLPPFPESVVPTFGQEICSKFHVAEMTLSAGVDYSAGVSLGFVRNITGNIFEKQLLSGCFFKQGLLDTIKLTFTEKAVNSINGSLIPVLRQEIVNVLGIPAGEIYLKQESALTVRAVFISKDGGRSVLLEKEYKQPQPKTQYEVLLGSAIYSLDQEFEVSSQSLLLPSILGMLVFLML